MASLPSLDSDAPKLEHLTKDRPARAKRHTARRPMGQKTALITEDEDTKAGVDEFFSNRSVSTESGVTSPVSSAPVAMENGEDSKAMKKIKKYVWVNMLLLLLLPLLVLLGAVS